MVSGYASWAARWRVPLGYGLGLAYLVFSQPTRALLLAGAAVALAGVALRALAAGYLEKNVGLATSGPYAWTRNPLYLGSSLVGSGFALAGGSWVWGLAFLGFFFAIYWPVMHREEDALRAQFGEEYERYANSASLFFPTGRSAMAQGERFRWQRYRKNREYRALGGFLAAVIFLALKMVLR